MSFFSRSLFGRTVSVVVLSVLLTQLATTFVIRQFYVRPLLERALDDRANHIQTIVTTLSVLTPGQRAAFIRDFEDSEGARILPAPPQEPITGKPPEADSRLFKLEERLKRLISPSSRIVVSDHGDSPEVWISFSTPNGDYWYVTQRQRFDAGFPVKWGIMLVMVILLSVVGMYWGVRRINQPLRILTEAANQIAEGKTPTPVSESGGPQEISSLSQAFNSMQRALREFESNRTIMLAGVSHDLRTPLSRLRLALEMLGPRDAKTLEPMIQDLEEIDRIIDQFLDFARDNPQHWLVPGNINEVVHVTYERFQARNYPVTLDLCATPDDTLINERAMERVVTNLVENALRYGAPPITIRTETFSDRIRLAILDRGTGIPPGDIQRMMQPFTRLEPARTGHPGAGLGLAIVERIIRMHHGSFNLLPRPDGGLEARIELPRLAQDDHPA